MRAAVFLDRDGVINEGGQINRADEVQLVPRAAEAIEGLKAAGYAIVVVTNQGGLGEGFKGERVWKNAALTRADLEAIHAEMLAQLGPAAAPDLIKVCPHATYLNCNCRKPKPGMLNSAARELGLDLKASWMVGDRGTDLQAGLAAAAMPILVLTGDGQKNRADWDRRADIVPSIWEAAELILRSAEPSTKLAL
ncbi:MAG: HAD-IIIA family hydrolase [Chloroflexi bacterium]|nr:HAD-IIIA family hydrolase [Chloroflexota bacterium]